MQHVWRPRQTISQGSLHLLSREIPLQRYVSKVPFTWQRGNVGTLSALHTWANPSAVLDLLQALNALEVPELADGRVKGVLL